MESQFRKKEKSKKNVLKKIKNNTLWFSFGSVFGIIVVSALIWAFKLGGYFPNKLQSSESTSSEVVKYLKNVDETVFLDVGLQVVKTQKNDTKIPWTKMSIPLTEKKAIIILNYAAKLGIKKPVKIVEQKDNEILVKVPKYEVIGTELDKDNPYQLYDSSGDLLSYSTKAIDTGELVTSKLSNKQQEKYLKAYEQQMNESAKNHFETLFKAVNPEVHLTFEFDNE